MRLFLIYSSISGQTISKYNCIKIFITFLLFVGFFKIKNLNGQQAIEIAHM